MRCYCGWFKPKQLKNSLPVIQTVLSSYRKAFSNLPPNIWVLSVSMFINRSGSMVLLFTSLYLTRELHFSIATAGFIMSFYGIGSVLGSYLGGWLTDRRDHFSVMFGSLIFSGIVLLFLIPARDPVLISLILFTYSLLADTFRPANAAAIALYSTPENRTRSVSLVRLAINLGFSVGPAAGGFIALYLGYKWLFMLDAATGFAAALLLHFYLPREPHNPQKHHNPVLKDKTTSAYQDRIYLIFILLVALYATSFSQLFASVPQYFSTVCHYSEDTIGLLLALNGLIVVLIEMPLMAHLEKEQRIFRYILAGTLCLPVAFGILLVGKGMLVWALVYTAVITLSEILAMPFMMNFALSRPKSERQGQFSALYAIAYGLANIIAPSLGLAVAARFGFDSMFLFFIGLSLIVALGFLWLERKHKAASQ